jgi:hypothetical protein
VFDYFSGQEGLWKLWGVARFQMLTFLEIYFKRIKYLLDVQFLLSFPQFLSVDTEKQKACEFFLSYFIDHPPKMRRNYFFPQQSELNNFLWISKIHCNAYNLFFLIISGGWSIKYGEISC